MPIIDATLSSESRDRYLTYALSVVSSRALPDVRDGLKPVQRRILFDMFRNLRLLPSGSHRKSAAVVGGVLARYHPHGDIACYEAMVRMAQDFSLRYPLIDGQGNFGSLDGDNAAAYRYTEVKLKPLAIEVVGEIDEETVNFRDNFDGTQSEPVVLPSRVPNLLVNGSMGIAVGMATSIPPHNLRDVIKALVELEKDPELSVSKLVTLVKAPDFPTGCQILNTRKELEDIYSTGRGAVRMRGAWHVESLERGKQAIIVTSIPYGIDKSQLIEKVAGSILAKSLPQLSDVRDESTEDVRIVLELASSSQDSGTQGISSQGISSQGISSQGISSQSSGSQAERAMVYLFKHTPLESAFNVNLTALVPTGSQGRLRPELLSLKQILQHFLDFRYEVTEKRLQFEKRKLDERIHILEGFAIIYDALDEVIKIVRKSEGRQDAAEKLKKRFALSELQAYAVVDLRIYQLSKTNIDEIRQELSAKQKRAGEIVSILSSKSKLQKIVVMDLENIASEFGDKRKSPIVKDAIEVEFNQADYVVQEDVYAIVTRDGWIKRIRQANELSSTRIREGDEILNAHSTSTLDTVLFFTNHGYLYSIKVIDFPSSSGYGDPIQKVLKFRDGESVVSSFVVGAQKVASGQGKLFVSLLNEVVSGSRLIYLTKKGLGFQAKLEDFEGLKRSGKRVAKVRIGDEVRVVTLALSKLALFTKRGSGLLVKISDIPERTGASQGVSVIGVRSDDELCAALAISGGEKIRLKLESGSDKIISPKDITSGRRGLKGSKVIARGGLLGAELLSPKQ